MQPDPYTTPPPGEWAAFPAQFAAMSYEQRAQVWAAAQPPAPPAPPVPPQPPAPPVSPAAPVPATALPAPGTNPFMRPELPAIEPAPRIQDLNGRLVAFRPTKYEAAVPNNLDPKGGTQQRVTGDVYVFDGGTLIYGGSPDYAKKPTPHTRQVEAPTMFTGVWITKEMIVRALTETPLGGETRVVTGIVIGRIRQSERGQNPWVLEIVPEESPDYQRAVSIFVGWQSGQPVNSPVLLASAPGLPAAQAAAVATLTAPMPPAAPQPPMPPAPPVLPQVIADSYAVPPAGSQWAAFPIQFAALSPAERAAVWAASTPLAGGVNPFAQG